MTKKILVDFYLIWTTMRENLLLQKSRRSTYRKVSEMYRLMETVPSLSRRGIDR